MSGVEKKGIAIGTRSIIGLSGSAPSWFIAESVPNETPALVVVPSRRMADDIVDDLSFFLGPNRISVYPAWETLPLEPVSPPAEISAQRIRILDSFTTGTPRIVVASVDALLQRVAPPDSIANLALTLNLNQLLPRSVLASYLLDCGFRVTRNVEKVGDTALKGAVVDIFSSTHEKPIRLEFDGDKLTKIRTFDVDSQRSLEDLSSVRLLPVSELTILTKLRSSSDPVMSTRIKERGAEVGSPPREVDKAVSAIINRAELPGMELLQYIAAERGVTVFDYIVDRTPVFLVDRFEIERTADEFLALAGEREQRLLHDQHLIPRLDSVYQSAEEFLTRLAGVATDELSHLELIGKRHSKSRNIRAESNIELATRMRSSVGTGEAFSPLKEYLNRWRSKKFSVAFVVGSASRAQRLQTILLNINTDAPILSIGGKAWIDSPRRSEVAILVGHLASGFRLTTEKLLFISENEIFGERSYRTGKAPRISAKRLLSSLSLLKEGDFVTHIDYGIGMYQGLRHLTVDGILGDFLQLDYADSKLYLPAHQIGKVQKFIAAEGQNPTVDRLGSTRWARAKQKIRDSIVTLAGDLIRLYAGRKVAKGWRFEPFGAEDERFADAFQYDETPDQRKAIQETIEDMSQEKPMDRLVCGDVGFGKTEVAIRASFKCTQHARQVAVLVPTTILVEQHYHNFLERFATYPVRVAAVSRFYPAEKNLETLQAVASGDVDIIIGTHRLLQPDVQFSDLGLLIIDEEHRFGVKQKERLRSYRTNVDVLTLTATPIPRTLHMSLLGIRDISLISTPPVDRKIVTTLLAEREDSLIRDSIMRELRRDGQCFFIHNRVQNIAAVAATLSDLVPEAKFDFAHGQMTDTELERIMKRFIEREVDVLVTTTIIESGLDVPNANTILIDRADQFGLAQLYQLRGRVGRSKRQAYAYFLVPHVKSLTSEAQERLKVLQSLDSLGIGFNLALRDLEIRGTGNLLGKEQSGSVLSVGFDVYCRILSEAVADLRGEEPVLEDVVDPDVRVLGLDAYIPESYVPDIGERLVLYQRLSNIRTDEEGFDLLSEMEDRFGPTAIEVHNLMTLMRFRGLLRRFGVVKSEVTPKRGTMTFSPLALLRDGYKSTPNTRVDGLKALKLVEREPHRYRFGKTNTLTVIFGQDEVVDFNAAVKQVEKVLGLIAYSS